MRSARGRLPAVSPHKAPAAINDFKGVPMHLRCSSCSGMMQFDESVLSPDKRVEVRCPHCSEVGPVRMDRRVSSDTAPVAETSAKIDEPSDTLRSDSPDWSASQRPVQQSDRPRRRPAQSDGSVEFRFPSESDLPASASRTTSLALKIAVWILASLGVIAVFALIVNIVLPGPAR